MVDTGIYRSIVTLSGNAERLSEGCGVTAFIQEKLLSNAKVITITHPGFFLMRFMKTATVRKTAEHEGQDVSQLPLQCSLVAEAISLRALSGTST